MQHLNIGIFDNLGKILMIEIPLKSSKLRPQPDSSENVFKCVSIEIQYGEKK